MAVVTGTGRYYNSGIMLADEYKSPRAFHRRLNCAVRATAWAVAVVVFAAVAGLEITAGTLLRTSSADRAGIAIVRGFSPPVGLSGLDSATGLGWTAAAMALALISRRWVLSPRISSTLLCPIESSGAADQRHVIRRRSSISFRSGGLYGP